MAPLQVRDPHERAATLHRRPLCGARRGYGDKVVGGSLWPDYRTSQKETEQEEVNSEGATDYAVRVLKEDGSYEPADTEELHWVSLNIAKKIAAKAWDALQSVVNSPVVGIEIINADYQQVQIAYR